MIYVCKAKDGEEIDGFEFRLECEKAVKNLEDKDFGRNIQGVIELLKLLRIE